MFALSSTLFIGNGGEVFLKDNEYYLRDLVEANSHLSPAFNCQTNSHYLDKIDSQFVEKLNLDKSLLAQKLCDMDSLIPNLSKILITAINAHSWSLITDELGLLPDDGPLLSSDVTRLQAANRTLYNIRIQQQIWNKINPKHKIALILHEVIFSLLKFNCTNPECSLHQQPARIARQITGLAFNIHTLNSDLEKNKLAALISYSLNSYTELLKTSEYDLKIRASFIANNNDVLLTMEKRIQISTIDFNQLICREYLKKVSTFGPLKLHITALIPKPFHNLERVTYPTNYGIEYGFKILNNNTAVAISKGLQLIDNQENCVSQLNELIEEPNKN
jgi:hypothetical protein